MLHVKHGHVLVHDDLESLGRYGGDQFEKLLAVEVVRRRDSGRALVNQVLKR
jgi:hypothetical protein